MMIGKFYKQYPMSVNILNVSFYLVFTYLAFVVSRKNYSVLISSHGELSSDV